MKQLNFRKKTPRSDSLYLWCICQKPQKNISSL